MAKVAPDYSFEREGVPLAQWLWRLVGDDPAARRRAGDVLQSMSYGIPSPETHLETLDPMPDMGRQMERFAQAIRNAVAARGFDTEDFVRRLCVRTVAASDDWLRRVASAKEQRSDEQFDRVAERLVNRINTADDEAAKAQAAKRLSQALCASIARDCRVDDEAFGGAEAMTSASFMAHAVFKALDRAFLAAPEALQLVLEHRQQAHEALEALARIGPPALAFAPQLIERIDHLPSRESYYGFDAAAALGSIGRGHAGVVDALIQRLRDANPHVRAAAAETLAVMGRDVAGRTDQILALLVAMTEPTDGDAGNTWMPAVTALASVGRDDAASRKRVIDLARPRPPRWVEHPQFPGQRDDRVMWERGIAIDAMRFLTNDAEECVPVLIEAIDTFEEYNPDECYSGPCGRVSRVLALFGPRAGAAAVPLARKLDTDPDDFPRAILDALAAMGPAASAALPRLEAFRSKRAGGDDAVGDGDDPVTETIRAIGGDPRPPMVGTVT